MPRKSKRKMNWKFWKEWNIKSGLLVTTLGSGAASILAILIGDPTAGAASAGIIAALLGLVDPLYSHIKDQSDSILNEFGEEISESLKGINESLRAIVNMILFFGGVWLLRMYLDLTQEYSSLIGILILFVSFVLYFYFTQQKKSEIPTQNSQEENEDLTEN